MIAMQYCKNKFSLPLLRACFFMLFLTIFCVGTPTKAHADNNDLASIQRLALELETNFWTLVENHSAEELKEKISDIFQGQNPNGFTNRSQFIAGLLKASPTSFSLNNLIATRNHNVLVVTYNFSAAGTGLVNGPTISVWKKGEHHWKLISHSYFATQP